MKYPIKDPRTCYEWFSKIEKILHGEKVLRPWVLICINFQGKISQVEKI